MGLAMTVSLACSAKVFCESGLRAAPASEKRASARILHPLDAAKTIYGGERDEG